MDKRYQVFVSSTFQDLTEERLEVIKALLELDCIPCGMEYFPAASEDSWTYIAQLIEQCDYYVVIVGGRYGSLTTEGVSFTQREYEYSLEKGIPSIAFVHSSPGDLAAKKTEESIEGKKKLSEFVAVLQKKNLCKGWSTSHELGAVVSRSITQLIRRHPRVGWIPANQASDPSDAKELLKLTKRNRELEEELRKIRGRFVAEVSDLADGNDKVLVASYITISKPNPKKSYYSEHIFIKEISISVGTTWNELFRAIAPKIAPNSNDAVIRKSINSVLKDRVKVSAELLTGEQFISKLSITDDWFNILKVQFTALGLVTIGKERLKEGAAEASVWRLTSIGENRMFQSFAIKKRPEEIDVKEINLT